VLADKRSRHLGRGAAISACLLLASCVSDPTFATGPAREAWLDAFQKQTDAAIEQRRQTRDDEIRNIAVRAGPTPGELYLSVDLHQAKLSSVIDQILQSGSFDYRANPTHLPGRISAKFDGQPLVPALNVLLEGTGMLVEKQNDILIFSYASAFEISGEDGEDSGSMTVSREIRLEEIEASDAVDLIAELYSVEDFDDDTRPLTISSLSELNTVYVSGPPDLVQQAVSILARADRPVPHVIISALVVEIDVSSVERIGANLTDLAAGSFSISSIVPTGTSENIVATFEELAGNTPQLTATINFLAAQNAAHVLSRPYIATRSTEAATIEIVDDQFARVTISGDDSSVITTDSITAGISMNITPVVMANSSIRVDLSIEDSRFNATAGDIIIAKERNAATSSMIVKSGQTIVIGGLNSRYRASERSGFPWLRKVPILSLFTAEQGALETREELVVYLTPYVWTPGLETPIPLQDALKPETEDLLGLERLGFGGGE